MYTLKFSSLVLRLADATFTKQWKFGKYLYEENFRKIFYK
jgi:hypothetical protein